MSGANRHYVLAAGGTGGHMLPAFALAQELDRRGHHVALITDGRFSGGTSGLSIGHASPEAAEGLEIAGDPALLRRFAGFFPLPTPVERG